MSIRFNHASNKITSTNTATIVIEGGTPTSPRPLRLDASSVVIPNKQLPVGEAGAVVFDINTKSLKYHNGVSWVELLSKDEVLAPINISLTEINNKLANRVSTVTYSSSSVASASVSGTNLNIVFPSSTTSPTDVPGLFTSSLPGSLMHYSLTSGQSVESIREQMSGVSGGQNGRDGSINAPFVTKTGWCFSDGFYWTWNGITSVTQQVPNLNQNAYLKSINTSGVTKTDSVVSGSGTISNTTIQEPLHYHGVGMMVGLSGGNGDDGLFISGKTWDDGLAYTGLRINGEANTRTVQSVSGSDSRTAFSTTYGVYPNGNTTVHSHNLTDVDVRHFNVAILYNIAQPSTALNQSAGDSRYVLKAGDTMTGSLTIANSAAIRANDTNVILWFQNSTGGERGAIYHNATTNSLRLRSAGGSEVVIDSSGNITSSGSIVTGNTSIVGGRNVLRSVNGITADGNGSLNIDIGVQDIRLSAMGTLVNRNFVNFDQGRAAYAPDGSVMVGVADTETSKIWVEDVDAIFYRYVQKQIGGVWYTVGVL